MNREKLSALFEQLRKEMGKYVPVENISGYGSFEPDTEDVFLNIRIAFPKEA
ncbi:Uncharacterised protein [uncultured Anaerotruncus sp.]|uniref:Uncharacterized protein n=1 Tax=uncultured Anaerotruncus sp. TaxID=905011 RepID=A0A6N2UQV1_9FIRM